eukprot:CAMPEP_0172151700 /NCGR_PEP_ID=MMETSP1050-20130122/382_1 /TAXON_ID=233186 /ORGANISM="Cryptomonas curvata, Strain CCAP979/52" /LENGTH=163 /DNA_ID=CAMNT_0012819849 /DNA_START=57 /DNA_END=549 /DNA_ORIENTATION=+
MDDSQEITSTTESLVSGMFADLRFARSIGSRRKSLSRRKGGGSNDKLTSPQGQFQADHHNHYANAAQICFSSSLETASSYNFAQQQALSLIEIKSIRGEDARHLHQSDRDNKNDFFRIQAPQSFLNQCAGYRRKNATLGQLRNYSALIDAPLQHYVLSSCTAN